MALPQRDMLATIGLRIFGGLVGTLPPLIALGWLDRAAYGHAMANYALALMLLGPISQYITQGYLRELLHQKTESGVTSPSGTIVVYAYVLLGIAAAGLAAAVSVISWADAAIIATMLAISAVARMQEAYLVARGHQDSAVLLFYVLPPLLHAALIIVMHAMGMLGDFWNVAVSQIIAYGGCLVASLLLAQGAAGRTLLLASLSTRHADWQKAFASVRHFLASGALLSTTEQVPIVILNTFGLGAVIPSFELARKVSAVPQVFIHALNMHMMPDLIRYVAANAWDRFRTVLGRFILVSGGIGCLYVAAVIVGLLTLQRFSGVGQSLDMPVFVILLAAAAVTAIGAPIGSALVALNGEMWWTLAASISLAVQLLVSFLGLDAWGAEAIALSMLAQAVVLRAIVTFGTALLYANRETQDAAFQGAS